MSILGVPLPEHALFADYFEPDEVVLLEALPGEKPGVVPVAGRRTKLHDAAKRGDVAAIRALSKQPELINSRTADGLTPLILAAKRGKVDAVNALAELGADLELALPSGRTALYTAAWMGHANVVRALGAHGANPATPEGPSTPMMIAADRGFLDVVNALAELGADVNAARPTDAGTALYFAAKSGHVNVVRALGALGADPSSPPCNGYTPLLAAVVQGHVDVVNALAELGADVNAARPTDAGTAMYFAAKQGHVSVVLALGALGTDPSSPCRGFAPLMTALAGGHVGVANALAELGADANLVEPSGWTALHWFCRCWTGFGLFYTLSSLTFAVIRGVSPLQLSDTISMYRPNRNNPQRG
jgi:ankyrin repeat protein